MSAHKRKALLKVIVLGESGVGKTSLLLRYVNSQFTIATKSTIGADFLSKELDVDGKPVTLQIWDTAGQERFQGLGTSFYRGADGVFFVFDVTRRQTFDELDAWQKSFLIQTHQTEGSFPTLILANKIDLPNRVVSKAEADKYCSARNISNYETSAKDAVNVNKAFEQMARLILARIPEDDVKYEPVDLNPRPVQQKGCC